MYKYEKRFQVGKIYKNLHNGCFVCVDDVYIDFGRIKGSGFYLHNPDKEVGLTIYKGNWEEIDGPSYSEDREDL